MSRAPRRDRRAKRPADPAALQQQANDALAAGRHAEALDAAEGLIAFAPERADVRAFAGMIALAMGASDTAIIHYQAAIERRPDFAEAHYNLAQAHQQRGDQTAAVAAYRRATEVRPDLAPAWHNLGGALLALGELDEALAACERAVALAPQAAEPQRNLGMVHHKTGRLDTAAQAFERAAALKPGWTEPLNNLVNVQLEAGDAPAAIATCERWLTAEPGSVFATAMLCVALNEAGDFARRDALLDFDRLVMTKRWEAAPGYNSVAGFNRALAEHAVRHETLKVPPKDDPTYHHPALHITEELLAGDKGPMSTLEAMMREAIAEYRATRDVPADHPFLRHFPERWRISSWAVVLTGEGNLVPHIHLDGYLGGVYYPELPAAVDDSDAKTGWFELGRPPDELPLKAAPHTQAIRPEEGLMILFPGYFYHATIPFQTGERRISVAFDLVAEE